MLIKPYLMHQITSITIDQKLLTINSWKTMDFDECFVHSCNSSIDNTFSSLNIVYPHLMRKFTTTRGSSQILD